MVSLKIPETQKAAQYHRSDNAIHVNEIPVPKPLSTDLLVKTICSSLCRSDLMNFEPNDIGLKLESDVPVTLGHEAAGVIVSVGSECKGFKIGDEVGFLPATNCCYECEGCQIHQMWCEKGCKMPGHAADGFFQEYIAVDWRNAIVLPPELRAVEAAPLFCAGVTSYHGIDDCRLAGLKEGEWMAIIGVGGLGHLGVQYARAMGFKIIALDINDIQLEEAKECGTDYAINTRRDKDYAKKVKEITKGGCHAVVNYTNSKAAYESATDLLRINGILMVVGLPQEPLSFNSMFLALRKFRVVGSSNKIPRLLPEFVDFSVKHGIKSKIAYYKLEEINEMIDLMKEGKFRGRVAVKFD
ncbi:GroES-like protein [Mytilinidion resinicola]|uniref:GroES-like protein n=1 Tax=Mytilinidion resinicola TaxID=574789 RepID=A0A6A6Y1C9_9PEZI|nr:GroES-like protein [Mytilinidion resinicola]KAF2801814.1 GroES-like protein [Mytilinidion resinicola]